MSVITESLLFVCFVCWATPSGARTVKRIADGERLESPHDYGTYYFVHLRLIWGCIVSQVDHELGGCQEQEDCGGTLIHPEFVLTAQHCVYHRDFYMRAVSDIYNTGTGLFHFPPGNDSVELGHFRVMEGNPKTLFAFEVPGQNVSVQPIASLVSKHAFYSNIALMAGGIDFFRMEQKRHAQKAFPHPKYHGAAGYSTREHDVSIIMVCEPFRITRTVRVAPIKPVNMLSTQWAEIVKKSLACLYIGFGDTLDPTTNVHHNFREGHVIPTQFLRYTWRHTMCPRQCISQWLTDKAEYSKCAGCSDHIPPRLGTPQKGDSGGPVVCDGFYVAVMTARKYIVESNETNTWIYPLSCIPKAFTPEAFKHYKEARISTTTIVYTPMIVDVEEDDR